MTKTKSEISPNIQRELATKDWARDLERQLTDPQYLNGRVQRPIVANANEGQRARNARVREENAAVEERREIRRRLGLERF